MWPHAQHNPERQFASQQNEAGVAFGILGKQDQYLLVFINSVLRNESDVCNCDVPHFGIRAPLALCGVQLHAFWKQ